MRLKSISLSNLHQLELVSFVEDVLKILKKHDLSALHIKEAPEMLFKYNPQVTELAKEYGPCPIARQLTRKTHHKAMKNGCKELSLR